MFGGELTFRTRVRDRALQHETREILERATEAHLRQSRARRVGCSVGYFFPGLKLGGLTGDVRSLSLGHIHLEESVRLDTRLW